MKRYQKIALGVLALLSVLAITAAGSPWARQEDYLALLQRVEDLEARVSALEGGGGGGGGGDVCTDGDLQPCDSGNLGVCAPGQRLCSSGAWGECLSLVGPTEEICDGVDNDCDGQVDEGGGSVPNGSTTCGPDGSYGVVCDPLFANCNGDLIDGCEAQLDDVTSCGTCGNVCDVDLEYCDPAIGDCQLYFPNCGNGVLEPIYGETCDDGNTVSGDGCDKWCQLEP